MAALRGHDIGCTLPAGWDGRISVRGDGAPEAFAIEGSREVFTAVPQPVAHIANVELMGDRDVLIVLFEYEPAAAASPLFKARGIPRSLSASQFDPTMLRRGIAGQVGFQTFFHQAGRAFCLYVVLGNAAASTRLVKLVNSVLATVEISPRAAG